MIEEKSWLSPTCSCFPCDAIRVLSGSEFFLSTGVATQSFLGLKLQPVWIQGKGWDKGAHTYPQKSMWEGCGSQQNVGSG